MRKIAVILMMISASVTAWGVPNEGSPKIVVGITIDHLRADYITRFWDTFQNDGFKRIFTDGAVFENARADIHNIKTETLIPSIYTGTYPSVHGIIGEKWYKPINEQEVQAVVDDYYLTMGSDSKEGNVSARQLKVFTIGDVLKQQSGFRSKVYSVALNASASALSAGHSADGAFWFDKTNGNMITSSYYADQFPEWIMDFNSKNMAADYLGREWDLMLPKNDYNKGFPDAYLLEEGFWERWNTFPYDLKKIGENQEYPLEILKASPFGNSLIRDFSVQLIEKENLGVDEWPDMLNLTFSMLDYANKWYNPSSVEMHEMMLRIDREIASLLRYMDNKFGKDNYLVILTSASTTGYPVRVLKEELNFNADNFNPQSAMALLRSYLNILYGVGDWIESYNEEMLYLNHRLIDSKQKPLNEMRNKAASFLNQFSGVKSALPAHLIETGNLNNPRFKKIENSYSVQRSGDVMLLLEEGWYPTFRYHKVDYSTENRIPLAFYGMYVKNGKHSTQTEVVDIVPTICKILGIYPPDDAMGKVLNEVSW
ncbi:MAG: alkaline phosphatase family protein [Prolixibacteraceae bacterium]|nr:alkaline phosphatase family protein [Prolixibacteraceae bacterium]